MAVSYESEQNALTLNQSPSVWAVYLFDSASREAIHPWCQSQGRIAGLKFRIEVRDRAGQRRRYPARLL